jgi:hypothetical protein
LAQATRYTCSAGSPPAQRTRRPNGSPPPCWGASHFRRPGLAKFSGASIDVYLGDHSMCSLAFLVARSFLENELPSRACKLFEGMSTNFAHSPHAFRRSKHSHLPISMIGRALESAKMPPPKEKDQHHLRPEEHRRPPKKPRPYPLHTYATPLLALTKSFVLDNNI